jgi:Flp pilus assembly protein TadD
MLQAKLWQERSDATPQLFPTGCIRHPYSRRYLTTFSFPRVTALCALPRTHFFFVAELEILRTSLSALLHGKLDEAEAGYRRVLEENSTNLDALHLLGVTLMLKGEKPGAAELYIRQAISFREDPFFLHTLGTLLQKSQRNAEAITVYQRVIELKPESADSYNNLGVLFKETNRLAEAEAAYRKAIELKPDFEKAHSNLGVLFKETGRIAEAKVAYRYAIELKPDYPEAHNNIGVLHKDDLLFAEAEAAYRRALSLKPDYANAQWNLGLLLLTVGRYGEAWPYYESRYHPNRTEGVSHLPKLAFPQWKGESLQGKSLLIWPEQGLGDFIQFARFLPRIKELGASRITLLCHPPLKPLLETVSAVDHVIVDFADAGTHDFWVLPLSLPLHLDITLETLPARLPYVRALPERLERWHRRLPAKGLKVGLVWKGNPQHLNDANRSLPSLKVLAPLWSVPGINYISLQKGAGEEEVQQHAADLPIIDLGSAIEDLADTAAIVAQLDLVICVDTVVAHVAGALGKPCWLLVPAVETDWRWFVEGTDSPWYPGVMRIFRQSSPHDWSETVKELVAHMKLKLAADPAALFP